MPVDGPREYNLQMAIAIATLMCHAPIVLPAVARGELGTAVLAGRFQVQVRSKSSSFTAEDREAWLAKFDLSGLSGLAP